MTSLKNQDEIGLREIRLAFLMQRKFMLLIFLFLMLIFFMFMFFWPKTYISESLVQIASIGLDSKSANIFDPVEAKAIMESRDVLEPAVNEFNLLVDSNKSVRRFKESNLEVELYKERIGRDEVTANALLVRVKSDSPEASQKVNQKIIDSFLKYSQPFYYQTLNVFLDDFEQTEKLISNLDKDYNSTRKILEAYQYSGAGIDSASDKILLTQVQNSHRGQMISLIDRKIKIENALAGKREFKILGYPEIPKKFSSPPLKILTPLIFIVSIFISLAAGILRQSYFDESD